MRLTIDYGRTGLEIEVPDRNLAGVLRLRPEPPLPDPGAAVRAALDQPLGAPPLAELARGKRSACVVISDITRPVPNRLLLPPILATLEAAGIPRAGILILVATGTHRASTPAELLEMVGEGIVRDYRIENHDARDPAAHVDLGVSPRGVPMLIDRRYLEAEVRVAVALIEPHFMAGYSGGRKSVCPGLASLETVKVWHGPRFLEHPRAATGCVEGNPEHEEALLIARAAGPCFIVDVTLDEQKRVTGVYAGDLEQAWLAGVRAVEATARAPLAEPVDVAIASSAGYPLDLTYYQAVKGSVGALPILKDGGTVILAARCAEGVGGREFTETLLGCDDLEAFIVRTYEDGFFVPDQWGLHELAKVTRKAELLLYTEGIPPETVTRCFATPIPSVEAGLERALARHGPAARIAVIPRGPYVVPVRG